MPVVTFAKRWDRWETPTTMVRYRGDHSYDIAPAIVKEARAAGVLKRAARTKKPR